MSRAENLAVTGVEIAVKVAVEVAGVDAMSSVVVAGMEIVMQRLPLAQMRRRRSIVRSRAGWIRQRRCCRR